MPNIYGNDWVEKAEEEIWEEYESGALTQQEVDMALKDLYAEAAELKLERGYEE